MSDIHRCPTRSTIQASVGLPLVEFTLILAKGSKQRQGNLAQANLPVVLCDSRYS